MQRACLRLRTWNFWKSEAMSSDDMSPYTTFWALIRLTSSRSIHCMSVPFTSVGCWLVGGGGTSSRAVVVDALLVDT